MALGTETSSSGSKVVIGSPHVVFFVVDGVVVEGGRAFRSGNDCTIVDCDAREH